MRHYILFKNTFGQVTLNEESINDGLKTSMKMTF